MIKPDSFCPKTPDMGDCYLIFSKSILKYFIFPSLLSSNRFCSFMIASLFCKVAYDLMSNPYFNSAMVIPVSLNNAAWINSE